MKKPKLKQNKLIPLPTTVEQYDALLKQVMRKFKLKDETHASGVMSVAIRHLPNEEAHTTLNYLGSYILKNLANSVANFKGQMANQKAQVAQLVSIIKEEPGNQQAWDELIKASEHSPEAKVALSKLESPPSASA